MSTAFGGNNYIMGSSSLEKLPVMSGMINISTSNLLENNDRYRGIKLKPAFGGNESASNLISKNKG